MENGKTYIFSISSNACWGKLSPNAMLRAVPSMAVMRARSAHNIFFVLVHWKWRRKTISRLRLPTARRERRDAKSAPLISVGRCAHVEVGARRVCFVYAKVQKTNNEKIT